jgi:glucose/arabinose dehydrogenase
MHKMKFLQSLLLATTITLVGCAAHPTEAQGSTPALQRNDLSIRKVGEAGAGMMRLDKDPALDDTLFFMDTQGNVSSMSIKDGKTQVAHSSREIGDVGYAMGMAFGPDGALYIAGNQTDDSKSRCIVRKGTSQGSSRQWATLAQTEWYPKSDTQWDHNCNAVAVSPDNKWVYLNIGSRTDHGEVQSAKGQFAGTREVPLTSVLLRMPTTARNLTLPNDEAKLKAGGFLFADGVRNTFDLAFLANGDLIGVDNGPDMTLPDELNWLREGRHYGFPWRYGDVDTPVMVKGFDPKADGRLSDDFVAVKQNLYQYDPDFPKPPAKFTDPIVNAGPDADQFQTADGKVQDASSLKQPLAGITAHRSPLGLVFDTANALSKDDKGSGFLVSWGAAGGDQTDKGQDLLQIKLTKKGDNYQMTATQIAKNFQNPMDSVLIGNRLYVLDYSGRGAIWEITYPN